MLENLLHRQATRTIEGVSFPGIIHNMSYFLTDLTVYEDGIVECWDSVDLPIFKRKLRTGKVLSQVPEGAEINIHHLCRIQIIDAVWTHKTPRALFRYVKSLVKALNPEMRNLYNMYGTTSEPIPGGKIQRAKLMRGSAQTRTMDTDFLGAPASLGEPLRHFMKLGEHTYLVQTAIFKNGTVEITGLPERQKLPFEEFENQIQEKPDNFRAETGDRVRIDGLVEFTAGSISFELDEDGLLGELSAAQRKVRGLPALTTIAAKVFKEYCANPTETKLEELREAYEAVPTHQRCYCGGMDERDIPIRIALYGDKEIENWSHWQLAKAEGLELPSLDVPKPNSKN